MRFITDPADYVRPEPLTFPVKFDPLSLSRKCDARGRLKVSLGGDEADVRRVDFSIAGSKGRRDRVAPFTRTFPASAIGRARGARLRAEVRDFDGARTVLKRAVPRCRAR